MLVMCNSNEINSSKISFYFNRPDPNNPLIHTSSSNILYGGNTPIETNGTLLIMIVVKYEATNQLCTAASAAAGRRRRSVTLGNLELALPQDVLQQIIVNPSL